MLQYLLTLREMARLEGVRGGREDRKMISVQVLATSEEAARQLATLHSQSLARSGHSHTHSPIHATSVFPK